MNLGLDGKRAVVTGGSVGIGLGVARAFAREGTSVAIAARDGARAGEAARSLAADFGAEAVAVDCDVATAEGCGALIAAVDALGGADIRVNNAGTGLNETILEAPDAKWQAYWDLHVMAAVRLARGPVPGMKVRGRWPAILNNASICAVQPLRYQPVYNVTKAALLMLSKTMATEFVQDGIRVNAVNPGLILTPDWIKTARQLSEPTGGDWEGCLQGVADEHAPIRRFGTVGELADFMVFLCSDGASYSVGSTYHVDGGMLRTL